MSAPRPLYHDFAWAYDQLVGRTGPATAFAAHALRDRGVEPGGHVVDAGCGTGADARELAAAGYGVTGIDRSPELIDEARRLAPEATFLVGDLLEWRPSAPADGVLCRGVLNDVIEDGERGAALHAVAEMLRAGGVLVVDVRDWERSAARYEGGREARRSASGPDGAVVELRSRTRLDPARRQLLVDERIDVFSGGESHTTRHEFRMRCWTCDELTGGLGEASFASIDLVDPAVAGAREDRIVAVARRA